ncbi:flavin-dependent dehydrogenase [Sphingomonas vulcanisoli]|uniref:Flavin-dependent dehydrogenase n=1 Tax=Sphingomonas vulcanisoli TaxID=1658060 RepID=A0ABX0TR92_9SPHN|nr:FAD-dependent monooxygenase [Sphingomonas vulcanisoli]NIJ06690.1 flavin-dependent dehydrogenase [Sphingomonas vulcanisoli]
MTDDVVIVGGGLAGGAAATLLARAGRHVRLLERDSQPAHKICGEFLSEGPQQTLARLGVDLDYLGASAITTLRLVNGRHTIEAPLPFIARGITRKRLDAALLDRAAAAGATIERGTAAREIRSTCVETAAGSLRPAVLMLASGKHEVRGAARDTGGCEIGYVGFKTYWQLSPSAGAELEGLIVVILFEGGYAGLQLVEDRKANLCLLIGKRQLASVGGTWEQLLARLLLEPHLEALLGDAVPLSPKPLAIAGVPYGFLHAGDALDGFFRLGDQGTVIPSFCGEGMAIALRSAVMGAAMVSAGGTSRDHATAVRKEFGNRVRLAMLLQRAGKQDWSRNAVWAMLSLYPAMAGHLAKLTRVPQ